MSGKLFILAIFCHQSQRANSISVGILSIHCYILSVWTHGRNLMYMCVCVLNERDGTSKQLIPIKELYESITAITPNMLDH